MKRKERKLMITAAMVLYLIVGAVIIGKIHPFVHALEKETVVIDIGAGNDKVKASLSVNGVLTVSGSGRTRDYTEESAPFEEYGEQIRSVEIENGITAIGDYLFYNCHNLKGRLVLPESVIWIGDGAFSGSDQEQSPQFTVVVNKFESGEIARPLPGVVIPEKETTKEVTEGTATPGEAERPQVGTGSDGQKATVEDGTDNVESSADAVFGNETEAPGESGNAGDGTEAPGESGTAKDETEALGESENTGDETKAPGGNENTGDKTEVPGGSENAGDETEAPKKGSKAADESRQSTIFSAAGHIKHGVFFAVESKADNTNETSQAETGDGNTGKAPQTETGYGKATASDGDDEEDGEEKETEESEESEESGEDGVLTNDLYENAVAWSTLDKSMRDLYQTETVTSQILGTDIFFTGQSGAYQCNEENVTFIEAAETAGYRKAERFIEVHMEEVTESYPIVNGILLAPELPARLRISDTDDPIFEKKFVGWLQEESAGPTEEVTVYTPGMPILVADDITQLVLYAEWKKICSIAPLVKAEAREAVTTYCAVDESTGNAILEMSGYRFHYQWQICRPTLEDTITAVDDHEAGQVREEGPGMILTTAVAESEEIGPGVTGTTAAEPEAAGPGVTGREAAEPEATGTTASGSEATETSGQTTEPEAVLVPADPNNESSWEDIEGADEAVYTRTAAIEDLQSYFRVKISVEKMTFFRSALKTEPVSVFSAPVSGKSILQKITVIYEPGEGEVGTPSSAEPVEEGKNLVPLQNPYTHREGKAFTGWQVGLNGVAALRQNGSSVSDGESILETDALTLNTVTSADPSVTLTAQWAAPATVYLNGIDGNDGNDGSSEALAVRTFTRAYAILSGGSMAVNRIVLCGNYPINGDVTLGAKPATITATKTTDSDAPALLMNAKIHCSADTTFENLVITASGTHGIFGNGHRLIMGYGLTMNSQEINVYGGAYDRELTANTDITVCSGSYVQLTGGGARKKLNGNTRLTIYGGYVSKSVYGAVSEMSTGGLCVTGNVNVQMYDGDCGVLFSGCRWGEVRGNTTVDIYGGNVRDSYAAVHSGNAAKNTGLSTVNIHGGTIATVYGGAYDANANPSNTPCMGGVALNMDGGTVRGNLFCGSYGYWGTPTYFSVRGGIRANFTGGTINGNLYGGSDTDKIQGDVNINISGITVVGNVFGGGHGRNNSAGLRCPANTEGNVTLNIDELATIGGNIYGGADSDGTITGNVTINCSGTAVNLYGGGLGSSTSVNGRSQILVDTGAGITSDVYGAGDSGSVKQGSSVEIRGGYIGGSVFGAGNSIGTTTSAVTISGSPSIGGSIYGGSNDQGTVTSSTVNISGSVDKNIFGGGNGSGTTVVTSNVKTASGAIVTGEIYGGGKDGAVQNSNVTLEGGTVETVFGGGSAAGITGTAAVNLKSGAKATNIYGGSNKSGTVSGAQLSIFGKVTRAYGGGQGEQTTTVSPSVTVESGAVVTELYGGGQKGKTTTGTTVLLKNGSQVKDLFGGGNQAGIEGTATVTTEEGSCVLNIYGGSNDKGTVTQSAVTVGGTVGSPGEAVTAGETGTVEGPGNVYGGGKGVNTSTATTGVTIGSTAVIIGNVFGGGAEGPVTGDPTVILSPSSHITGNVYAGGDAASVGGSTRLEANDGVVITGSLFGGGKGKEAVIQQNTRVLAFANVTGHVFGGGAEGSVGGSTHVDIAKGRVSGNGESGGNVFGGSDRAEVKGNTQVHIGKVAAVGTETDVKGATLIIEGTVFGGGNTTDNGSNFDASKPFVLGDSEVSVDATDYDTPNFNIQKSILGDGNMCTVGGTRTVSIKNYEALEDQSNTSVQRADVLTLDTSHVELTGAIDSANLVPTIAYSLNRIDQLIMKGGSTLRIQAPVNLVKNLISQDAVGNPVMTTATTDTAAEPGTKNRIDILQGVQMELRTSEDVTTMQYGMVSGYMLLDAYDSDPSKKIESGIYVLGSYAADESLGGFLYGSGDSQYKKIDPSTDEENWRNWAIGTDMKKEIILVMSDKPAGGKIAELESPWPADGSIYRLIQNTAEEKNHVTITGTGEKFVLKDPEALDASDPINTTLGISIQAGSQGWINPMTMGYIAGDSENGANGGGYGGLATNSMQTLNNRTIKPKILVELTNQSGITKTEGAEEYPLTVSFQLENVRQLSDGGFSTQGTLTVNILIRRESLGNYDDVLISPGKEYVRAIQDYPFATKAGSAGATISQKSAVTLQYGKKSSGGTAASSHKLKFSYGDAPGSAGTAMKLPAGVTILAVDRSGADPVYAHYTVPSGGVEEVELGQFIKNGTSDPYSTSLNYYDKENYLFILDFANAPDDFSQDKLCVTFETVYGTGSGAVANEAKILFSVVSRQANYRIASSEATGSDKEGSSYDREAVIPLTLSTYAEGGGLEVDTTGTEAEMGVYLRLKNRDTGVYVPVPTDWFVTQDGKKTGELTGNGISVILGNGMMNSTSSLGINMKPGSLSAGKYQWEIHLTSASLAAYPGRLTGTPLYMNFNIMDKRYSIKADYKDPSASRLYPSMSTDSRLPLELRIEAKLENGAAAEGVIERASLWKKDQTTGEYSQIEFSLLFEDLIGVSKDYDLQDSQDHSYTLKDTLSEGTYRLKYELIQTKGGVDQLLTYDTENFIVTP